MELNSADDWWSTVDRVWDSLVTIIGDQMDLFHAAYETPGDDKSEPTGRDIGRELEWLRENKDTRLVRYFQAAWCLSSDAYAYSVPYWGTLCDLCSENYLVEDTRA